MNVVQANTLLISALRLICLLPCRVAADHIIDVTTQHLTCLYSTKTQAPFPLVLMEQYNSVSAVSLKQSLYNCMCNTDFHPHSFLKHFGTESTACCHFVRVLLIC